MHSQRLFLLSIRMHLLSPFSSNYHLDLIALCHPSHIHLQLLLDMFIHRSFIATCATGKLLWACDCSISASLQITSSLSDCNLAFFAEFVYLMASKTTIACAFTSSLLCKVGSFIFPLPNIVSCDLSLHLLYVHKTDTFASILYCMLPERIFSKFRSCTIISLWRHLIS